ncbi:MAG: penicillin acylase family protein, partial [Planctomycetota bacterium]
VGTVRVARPTFGSSCQLVVSPGNEATGILTMPGGVSGNPLSPVYRGEHAAWATGTASPLLVGTPVTTTTLEPR